MGPFPPVKGKIYATDDTLLKVGSNTKTHHRLPPTDQSNGKGKQKVKISSYVGDQHNTRVQSQHEITARTLAELMSSERTNEMVTTLAANSI